jgi:hypothetical protein
MPPSPAVLPRPLESADRLAGIVGTRAVAPSLKLPVAVASTSVVSDVFAGERGVVNRGGRLHRHNPAGHVRRHPRERGRMQA